MHGGPKAGTELSYEKSPPPMLNFAEAPGYSVLGFPDRLRLDDIQPLTIHVYVAQYRFFDAHAGHVTVIYTYIAPPTKKETPKPEMQNKYRFHDASDKSGNARVVVQKPSHTAVHDPYATIGTLVERDSELDGTLVGVITMGGGSSEPFVAYLTGGWDHIDRSKHRVLPPGAQVTVTQPQPVSK